MRSGRRGFLAGLAALPFVGVGSPLAAGYPVSDRWWDEAEIKNAIRPFLPQPPVVFTGTVRIPWGVHLRIDSDPPGACSRCELSEEEIVMKGLRGKCRGFRA